MTGRSGVTGRCGTTNSLQSAHRASGLGAFGLLYRPFAPKPISRLGLWSVLVVDAFFFLRFGIAAIAIGFNGRSTVKDNLTAEKIVGTPDTTPAAITAEAKKAGLNTSAIAPHGRNILTALSRPRGPLPGLFSPPRTVSCDR